MANVHIFRSERVKVDLVHYGPSAFSSFDKVRVHVHAMFDLAFADKNDKDRIILNDWLHSLVARGTTSFDTTGPALVFKGYKLTVESLAMDA